MFSVHEKTLTCIVRSFVTPPASLQWPYKLWLLPPCACAFVCVSACLTMHQCHFGNFSIVHVTHKFPFPCSILKMLLRALSHSRRRPSVGWHFFVDTLQLEVAALAHTRSHTLHWLLWPAVLSLKFACLSPKWWCNTSKTTASFYQWKYLCKLLELTAAYIPTVWVHNTLYIFTLFIRRY